jgi:predicted nucleic acid-binding protein
MIVLDASVVIELLLLTAVGESVAERLLLQDESLHAPHLVDIEVAQVLRRLSLGGQVKPARAQKALEDLSQLRIHRYPHTQLLDRVWELRANLTAYDASYVALAESLGAPLLTRDRRMSSAPGARAVIELV